jgi:diketogulonate reductase-like aldo/keto reductase
MTRSFPRRTLMTGAVGAAGLSVLGEAPAGAQTTTASPQPSSQVPAQPTDILMKRVGRTDETLPAIGLGTFLAFDTIPGQQRDHLGEVMRRYWAGGARVVDTSPLYGTAELTVGDYATALGISDRLFIANKIWATGDFLADESHALQSLRQSEGRLWRERIDLMQVHSLVNVDFIVPYLRAWKKEGRIRYLGVTHFENQYFEPLANWIQRGNLDVVQVNYSIFNRQAEERILPLAAERGTAVLTNMPFEKARLFKIVEGRPLPDFAREAGITTWAQYFLKWVISHPAVTVALSATSAPAHASENVAALRGPMPDAALRQRMVRHMETIPGFDKLADMPWYPGKRYPGIIGRAQAELRART